MLEEIPFELEVTDDHGLADYSLKVQVAGREPAQVSLLPEPATSAPHPGARPV